MATSSELVTLCLQRGTVPGCWTDPDTGEKSSILIAASYDYNGEPIPAGTLSPQDGTTDIGLVYTSVDGTPIDPQPLAEDVESGPCCACGAPECIESREWTFGVDNTGTRFNWDVDITVTLSDGSTFTFNQPPTAGWSQQITLWASEFQAAMPWTVSEPRCDLPNGCGGLPGTPTGITLPNMAWRYANVQVCPGDPIPVKAEISAINAVAPASKLGYVLVSDGPIEGPLLTFRRCQNCGEDAVWYEEDGVTPVDPGLEPKCSWPCGLPPAPLPESLCQFSSVIGCDTTGSADQADWIEVTRVVTICQGEDPQTNYYIEDTSDPEGGLVEYALVDDFLVDCQTGEPIPAPDPCADAILVKSCDPVCLPSETWCRRTDRVFLDNHVNGESPLGMVLYYQDTWEIEVTLSNGQTVTLNVGPHTSYPNQLADISAQMSALIGQPWANYAQGSDGNPATPYGNYAGSDVCPGDPVPVSTTALTVDSPRASRIGRFIPNLLSGVQEGDVETLSRCQCCGEAATWYDADGNIIDPPPEDCLSKSCDFPASPPIPEPDCTIETLGPVCEVNPGDPNADPVVPPSVVASDIYLTFAVCPTGTTLDSYTLADPDDPQPYELTDPDHYFGDCASLEPVTAPPPPCETFEIATFYRLDGIDGTIHNREWHDTVPAVGVSQSFTATGAAFRTGHDFSLPPDTDTYVSSLVLNDTDNTAAEVDVQVLEGYLVVDAPGIWLRYTGGSEGYWAIEAGICCGPLMLQDELGYSDRTSSLSEVGPVWFPAGVHEIRMWNIDSAGSNSSHTMGYSTDGVNFTNDNTPPGVSMSSVKPSESCITAKVCHGDGCGAIIDTLTCDVLDPAELSPCSLLCDPPTIEVVTNEVCIESGCEGEAVSAYHEITRSSAGNCSSRFVAVDGYCSANETVIELADGECTPIASANAQLWGNDSGVGIPAGASGSATGGFGDNSNTPGFLVGGPTWAATWSNDGDGVLDTASVAGNIFSLHTPSAGGAGIDFAFDFNGAGEPDPAVMCPGGGCPELENLEYTPELRISDVGLGTTFEFCVWGENGQAMTLADLNLNLINSPTVTNPSPGVFAANGTGAGGAWRVYIQTVAASVGPLKRVEFKGIEGTPDNIPIWPLISYSGDCCEPGTTLVPCDAGAGAPSVSVVTDEVCDGTSFVTRVRGFSADGTVEWTRYEDGLGNEATGVVPADPCECGCNCGCVGDAADCATEQCGILRLDADPASLSQSTLEGYTLEFTGTGFGCPDVSFPMSDETLTVVDVNGTNTIANFADVINAQLGSYGFSAAYCDQSPLGGTATGGQGVAVQGPTCPGSPWEIKFDSGGSGDDFAIGWDGVGPGLHAHEWVNGAALVDGSNSYSTDGGWPVRDCGTCAP